MALLRPKKVQLTSTLPTKSSTDKRTPQHVVQLTTTVLCLLGLYFVAMPNFNGIAPCLNPQHAHSYSVHQGVEDEKDPKLPPYILLTPTRSNMSCQLEVWRSSPFSGYVRYTGNCHGFIGTVILQNTLKDQRQLSRIIPPANLTWTFPMEKIDAALLTVYENVMPHEVLGDLKWVVSEDVTYHPDISVVNSTVRNDESILKAKDRDVPFKENPLVSNNDPETFLWQNRTVRGLPHKFDLSCYHSSTYKRIIIMGTSESRRLFDHVCSAISGQSFDSPSSLDKSVYYSQCTNSNLYFVNVCDWGCGCEFFPSIFKYGGNDLSNDFISMSCGLHGEYLKDASYYENSFAEMRIWAQRLRNNNTRLQYRITNAVNPLRTSPEKWKLARNNFRYRMFRDVAVASLSSASDVHLMDTFSMTESIFDLSEDYVHYPSWVYNELARVFLKSLCVV